MHDPAPSGWTSGWLQVLRWLAVLPAAAFASWLFRGVGHFLLSLLGIDLRGPGYPEFLFPLQQLLPGGLAFVLVGAWVAPKRQRRVAAGSLMVLGVLISVLIHVAGQTRPGLTNYMHFTGESLGALLGVVLVYYVDLRSRIAREEG